MTGISDIIILGEERKAETAPVVELALERPITPENVPVPAPPAFPKSKDAQTAPKTFHFASSETVTPETATPANASSGTDALQPMDPNVSGALQDKQEREENQEKQKKTVSLSIQLLERLCQPTQSVLENVQEVDLPTFLSAPALHYSEETLSTALRLYWRSSALKSEALFRLRQANELAKLAETASPEDQVLYRAAAETAQAKANTAKLALRANALELGRTAGYAQSVTAQTLPHAGNYETHFQQFIPTHGSRTVYLHGLIQFRRQQLIAAASACVSAENLLKMQMTEKKDAETVLETWETLEHRQRLFFDVLTEFNAEILQYVLLISYRKGPDLVPLLVHTAQSSPETERTFSSDALPQDTAMPYTAVPERETSAASLSPENSASIPAPSLPAVENTAELSPVPAAAEGPGLPTFAESVPENAPANVPVYEENAAIDVVLPTEGVPVVPSIGVPPTETAPPGSDFQPIGGPNGVLSDPTLGLPAEQNGAAHFQKDPFRRLTFRGIYSANGILHQTAKPSVLLNPSEAYSESTSASAGLDTLQSFQNGISLRNALERAEYSSREKVLQTYWHYVFLQKQICVLKYQETLLAAMTERVFADSENADAGKFGVSLEFHSLVLRTELLGTEAEAWKVLYRLSQQMHLAFTWPLEFPEALTELKAENFQLSTSRLSPGSAEEARFLPLIRQLYQFAERLPDAFLKVQAQESLIAPPQTQNSEKNSISVHIKTAPYEKLSLLLDSMAAARKDSFEYLKFLFQTNALYGSCILSADPFGSAPEKLEETLTR